MSRRIAIAGDVGFVKGVLKGISLLSHGRIKESCEKALLAIERVEQYIKETPVVCSKGGVCEWTTDGYHTNEFCRKCFHSKHVDTESEGHTQVCCRLRDVYYCAANCPIGNGFPLEKMAEHLAKVENKDGQ